MAKGSIAKDAVVEKIAEAFGEDFLGSYDKKYYVRAKENGQYINYVDIDFITDKGNVFCSFRDHIEMIDLSREEYNCILNYIRVYFLVNLHWMGRTEKFIIGNDPWCIVRAHNNGWI